MDRTVMNLTLVASHYNTNSLSVADGDYPEYAAGWFSCETTFSSPPDTRIYCNHGHVIFNERYQSPSVDNYWKATACQEFGHSVGLDHRTGQATCMDDDGDANNTNTFDQHDIDVINFIHA